MKLLTYDGVLYLWGKLKALLTGKVDKVDGKGLSTNDLTDTLKSNYDAAYTHSQTAHAPASAQANVIESVKVNGTALTVTSKAVNVTVPTKTSQITNDSGFLTSHQDISGKADKSTTLAGYGITNAYTKEQVDGMISSLYTPGGSVAFANLPTADEDHLGMVYNVTDAFTTTASFVEGAGKNYSAGTNVVVVSVDGNYKYDALAGFIDLSGYAKASDITAITNAEIDAILDT